MKIAVTYEGGQVYPHFGHTAAFKIYEVVDGKIVSAQVVETNGTGHSALADMLKELGVENGYQKIEGSIVVRDQGKQSHLLFSHTAKIQLVGHGQLGQLRQVELLQTGSKGDLDGFQRLSCALSVEIVVFQGDMSRFLHFQSLKQLVQGRQIALVILPYFCRPKQLHDHIEVLFLLGSFEPQ